MIDENNIVKSLNCATMERRSFMRYSAASLLVQSLTGCSSETVLEQNIALYCTRSETTYNPNLCGLLRRQEEITALYFSVANFFGYIFGSLIGKPVLNSKPTQILIKSLPSTPADFAEGYLEYSEQNPLIPPERQVAGSTRIDRSYGQATLRDTSKIVAVRQEVEVGTNFAAKLEMDSKLPLVRDATIKNLKTLDRSLDCYAEIEKMEPHSMDDSAKRNVEQLHKQTDQIRDFNRLLGI